MSITQGLFSDVLANAPGGGTADWSKTLPMAGAVDWTKVTPFQVINPLTGYNYGSTQGTAAPAKPAESEAPQMSEYQKWLAKQSQSNTDRGGGNNPGYQGTYTDKDWADIKAIRDELGWGNEVDSNNLKGFLGAATGFLTGNPLTGMGYAYQQAQKGDAALRAYQAAQQSGLSLSNYRDIVNQMSVNGQGGFMAGPAPNQGMSLADQYAAYNSGRVAYNEGGGGTTAAADPYSGSPGGESSGGSYAGGDFGYSGADRGSYF